MTRACILVKTVPTRVVKVLGEIRGMSEIKKAFIVFGRWDIVAWLIISDFKKLKEITSIINSLDGVRSTETLIES